MLSPSLSSPWLPVGAGGEGQYIAMGQTQPRQLVAEERNPIRGGRPRRRKPPWRAWSGAVVTARPHRVRPVAEKNNSSTPHASPRRRSKCGEHAAPGNRHGIGRSRVPAFVRLVLTVLSRVSSVRGEPTRTLQKASFWPQHEPLRHTSESL